jgi:dTDP-L-rhamnose 4-epimerase
MNAKNAGTVLVTGGAGLIGSHTVDQLLARGWTVRIYDSLELPTHAAGKPAYLPEEADFIHADVRDTERLRAALEGVDAVVHLAATGGFTPRIADYLDVNSLATARLLEIIRDETLPVRKVVVASSIAVYGEGSYRAGDGRDFFPGLRRVEQLERGEWEMPGPDGSPSTPVPTHESAPVDPATAYAISKYDQERLVLTFGRDTGIPTAALRYFVTYGPRQSLHNPYTGVCTIFASRIANDQPVVIYEDGLQTRDFVFVEDVARANVLALESADVVGEAFNVGTGVGTTMIDLAETLQRCLGKQAKIEIGGRFRPADVRHMIADTTRLSARGFRAETSLETGLEKYVEWLHRQGPLPEYFGRAESELRAAGIVRSIAPVTRPSTHGT